MKKITSVNTFSWCTGHVIKIFYSIIWIFLLKEQLSNFNIDYNEKYRYVYTNLYLSWNILDITLMYKFMEIRKSISYWVRVTVLAFFFLIRRTVHVPFWFLYFIYGLTVLITVFLQILCFLKAICKYNVLQEILHILWSAHKTHQLLFLLLLCGAKLEFIKKSLYQEC